MSYPMIDRASDLIEALKTDPENFEISNLIFKNHNSLRSIVEFYGLRSDLLEFAKDPQSGLEMLGPEPKKPTLDTMTDEEKDRAMREYAQMVRMYEDRRKALEMHVPYHDFMLIENYLDKFKKTFHATPAVKGLRFKAFTKDVEHEEKGLFSSFFKRNSQSAV